MPNHVHGIIILHERPDADASENGAANTSGNVSAILSPTVVGARHGVPLPDGVPIPTSNIEGFGKPVAGSLATIIRQYKSSVTRQIVQRCGGAPPIWQRNYYEHVIRDGRDHQHIHGYILNNPLNWETDDENDRCGEFH